MFLQSYSFLWAKVNLFFLKIELAHAEAKIAKWVAAILMVQAIIAATLGKLMQPLYFNKFFILNFFLTKFLGKNNSMYGCWVVGINFP
jgi:hypothetical protein